MEIAAINSIWPVSQKPVFWNGHLASRVLRSLSFLSLLKKKKKRKQNQVVPFKKAKHRKGHPVVLFKLQRYLPKAEMLKCLFWALSGCCAVPTRPHKAQRWTWNGQAEPGPTLPSAHMAGYKVTTNHKVTSAHWRDEWFGASDFLVPPNCLI